MSRKTCVICEGSMLPHEFIKDRNEHVSESFGYCKHCMKQVVENDEGNPIDALRMLNVPYVHSIWEQMKQLDDRDIFSEYLKRIALRRVYKDFHDSEFDTSQVVAKIQITDDIRAKWGYNYSDIEYEELEGSLRLLKKIKEPDNALEEKMYITTVLLEKRYNTAILGTETGNSVASLKRAYEESLAKLGLDKASDKDDIEFVGALIRKFESTAPIPEPSREFRDVDNVMGYMKKAFLTNAKRIFGSASEKEIADLYTNDTSIIPGTGNREEENE